MVKDFALNQVQRRATKLVKQVQNLSYEEHLKELKIPSIKDRVLRGDLIETYKILTGKIDVDPGHFFEMSQEERTRGHRLKLKKKRIAHQSTVFGSTQPKSRLHASYLDDVIRVCHCPAEFPNTSTKYSARDECISQRSL